MYESLRTFVDDCQVVSVRLEVVSVRLVTDSPRIGVEFSKKTYGYLWDGDDVKGWLSVGDFVAVPSRLPPHVAYGFVEALGCSWPGEFKQIIRRAPTGVR